MPAPLKPLDISALGLLTERPMHPYEMFQTIVARHEDRVVRVSVGSLYRTVERLTAQGYAEVVGTDREGNRPERTTYAVTDEGRGVMVARVRELLRTPVNEYPAFVLALAEAHNATPRQVTDDLTAHVTALDAEIEELDALLAEARRREVPEIFWVEGAFALSMHRAQREWLTTFIDRISKEEISWRTTTRARTHPPAPPR